MFSAGFGRLSLLAIKCWHIRKNDTYFRHCDAARSEQDSEKNIAAFAARPPSG